jgi:hypothetical protein
VSDPGPTPISAGRPGPGAAAGEGAPLVAPEPAFAGTPSPPAAGRASSFRRSQTQRRSAQREQIGVFLVLLILAVGIYTIVTARPYSTSSGYHLPTPGPPIVVRFGTPTVAVANCSQGGTASVERIPWVNSTQPITTGDFTVRVIEIWDGDFIGDPGAAANVTPSNDCGGAAPSSSAKWYVALEGPNGTNLATYTVGAGWVAVGPGTWNFGVQDGSTIVLVSYTSLANSGRGFEVDGAANGSIISGSLPL